jgi:hypothetical protein
MTKREAEHALRRAASAMLRKNEGHPNKALTTFCDYLTDDATSLEIFGAFAGAIRALSSPENGLEEDAVAYLVKLSREMPRAV